MADILELRNIYKSYGTGDLALPVLKDVTFKVEKGEYIAIMGPSGSGKSTLMNIIGCLDRADSGTYLLDGEDVSKLDENRLAEIRLRKIGFVFQTFQLLAGETALENVALPLVYAGVSRSEREKIAMESLEEIGLGDRASHLPNQLSGGQKQRVAIARAMVNHPEVLLADEPTGALDQASGEQVMKLFGELNEKGVTVIMITHDRKVASHAKRILDITDGIVTEGGEIQ